jgi:hypothetical protein
MPPLFEACFAVRMVFVFLWLFNLQGRLMPRMELDEPTKAQPAELRTQDRANPQNRDQTNLYTVARQKLEAERAAPAMAPAEPPARARAQRQAELTPALRQNHLKNEIDRVNARVASIDKRLEPDNVRKAAKSMGAEMASHATLEGVLRDPNQRQVVRNIFVADHSSENFEFLEAVENYRLNPTKGTAQEIYDNRVKDNDATPGKHTVRWMASQTEGMQVNVSGPNRTNLGEKIQELASTSDVTLIDPELFDVAKKEIFDLVNADPFSRIKRHPEFIAHHVEVCSTGIPNDLRAQKTVLLAEKKELQRELMKARVDGVKNFLGFGRSK